MPRKPLVGLVPNRGSASPTLAVSEAYTEALLAAGALPLILPYANEEPDRLELLSFLDGFLFTGGADVDPRLYGAPVLTACGDLQPQRDAFELPMIRLAVERGKPVLCICRGQQALNVALGGALCQDIDSCHPRSLKLQHNQKAPYDMGTHSVEIQKGSLLSSILGQPSLTVNSFHHQAVDSVAPGLVAVAWAADGVIEAVEGTGLGFVLGLQWHPEWMAQKDPAARAVFAAFVKACGKNKRA